MFWGNIIFPQAPNLFRNPTRPPLPLRFFRKSPRPSLPLKRAPPLTPTLSPQERGRKPLLLVARNRCALRLAGHQSPRQIVRDGTASLILACSLLATDATCLRLADWFVGELADRLASRLLV